MPRSLPDSYRRLAPYSLRLTPGTRLYDQGAVPNRFYVVLRSVVFFEVLSEDGEPEVVAQATTGNLVGHIAAFTGRPTSATARVDGDAVVLAIPIERVTEAIREAPELGLRLVYAFAGVAREADEGDTYAPPSADESLDVSGDGDEEAEETAGEPVEEGVIPVHGEVDSTLFFLDQVTCPVSKTEFQFPRVRTRAVRPASRDSDFHVRYHGMDPTRYGVVVCPTCAYAAYFDDFAKLDEETRARMWLDREARIAMVPGPMNGERSEAEALVALELAMRCYEIRGASDGRKAVLLHRRAWMERDAENEAGEHEWLLRARDAYRRAFEHDGQITDESAVRVAYLVGDLSMRLGDAPAASQWLETAVRVAPPTAASGIVRAARERLQDVRTLMKQQGRLAS